jgi:hypothetical protein
VEIYGPPIAEKPYSARCVETNLHEGQLAQKFAVYKNFAACSHSHNVCPACLHVSSMFAFQLYNYK